MGLNSASKNKDEAKKFLEWLATPEFAEIYANALPGFFPLSKSAVKVNDDLAATMVGWKPGMQIDDPQFYQNSLAWHAKSGERALECVGAGPQRQADAGRRRRPTADRPRQVVQAGEVRRQVREYGVTDPFSRMRGREGQRSAG